MSWLIFTFSALLIVIWIIAGGFITDASVKIHGSKDANDEMHKAYVLSTWAAVITWLLIGLFISLIILAVLGVVTVTGVAYSTGVGEYETVLMTIEGVATATSQATKSLAAGTASHPVKKGFSWFTIGFLFLALFLVTITGVLSALTASSMVKGNFTSLTDHNVEKLQKAYNDAIIAAVASLASAGLIIIGIITYIVIVNVRKSKLKQQMAETQAKKEKLELEAKQKGYAAISKTYEKKAEIKAGAEAQAKAQAQADAIAKANAQILAHIQSAKAQPEQVQPVPAKMETDALTKARANLALKQAQQKQSSATYLDRLNQISSSGQNLASNVSQLSASGKNLSSNLSSLYNAIIGKPNV